MAHKYTDEIICPHCDYEQPNSNDEVDMDDEGVLLFECDSCEETFDVAPLHAQEQNLTQE